MAFLDISYHCRLPNRVFRTQFMLTIRGTGRPTDAALGAAPANPEQLPLEPRPSDHVATHGAPCPDLEVTAFGPESPVRQGDPFTALVSVRNVGSVVSVDSQITLDPARPLSVVASQGSIYPNSWRNRRLLYYPGRLEPGAEATLSLSGLTWHSGTLIIPVWVSGELGDCNAENSRGEVRVTVTPDIPDLTAQWSKQQLTFSGIWPNRELRVRGSLAVSNDTQWDAGPSRVALFLSENATPGPADRFLGFRVIPALQAGASVTLEVTRDLPVYDPHWKPRLLALVDSSNSVYESRETDNAVASRPAR